MPPTTPSEHTLLPTTSSPAANPFSWRQKSSFPEIPDTIMEQPPPGLRSVLEILAARLDHER
jgi:hypothetical protein